MILLPGLLFIDLNRLNPWLKRLCWFGRESANVVLEGVQYQYTALQGKGMVCSKSLQRGRKLAILNLAPSLALNDVLSFLTASASTQSTQNQANQSSRRSQRGKPQSENLSAKLVGGTCWTNYGCFTTKPCFCARLKAPKGLRKNPLFRFGDKRALYFRRRRRQIRLSFFC